MLYANIPHTEGKLLLFQSHNYQKWQTALMKCKIQFNGHIVLVSKPPTAMGRLPRSLNSKLCDQNSQAASQRF